MKNLALVFALLFSSLLLSAQVIEENEDFQNDTIVRSFDYDIGIEAERVNFWSNGEVFGESGFYGQIPIVQTYGSNNIISFSAIIQNYGTVAVTPQLNISVKDRDNEEIYSQNVTLSYELEPGESDTLTTQAPYFNFEDYHQLGFIKFDFSCSIVGNIDENLENNTKSDSTEITYLRFARDNNNVTGSISPCDFVGGCIDSDKIGVIYTFNASHSIGSIDFWVDESTPIGSGFVPKLLEFDEDANDWVEFASGSYYEISEEDLGSLKSFSFIDYCYVYVPPNEQIEVLVAIEFYYGFETSGLAIGIDHTTPTNGFENLIYLTSQNVWTQLESNFSPIIRMTIAWDHNLNNNNNKDLCLFPNPTSGTVQFENFQARMVEVVNIDGQTVKICELKEANSQIDLSDLENGSYFLKLLIDDKFIVKKVILIK
ncbi:MAG: T9SS type A sorting domain-containing protein [Bacteroidales bacterium]|nr:T9SS type A sorting domain-containing protein [Bacteroidales bacterium]